MKDYVKRAKDKYKAKCKRKEFSMNPDTDADIIEHLESVENFNQYVKMLIRADIKKERG